MTATAQVTRKLDADTLVGVVSFSRGEHNFFDVALLEALADAIEQLAGEGCRAVVLRTDSRSFCAGMDVLSHDEGRDDRHIYDVVPRLFTVPVPVVAAVEGAAIGGGLGLALAADFRVASPEARFSANFAQLGFHHGFALTITLPALAGPQRAAELLYTGRRIDGREAHTLGLCDRLVEGADVDGEAGRLAESIARSAPLAVASIRATLRGDLIDNVVATLAHERREQERLMATDDFREGLRAAKHRRTPAFRGL